MTTTASFKQSAVKGTSGKARASKPSGSAVRTGGAERTGRNPKARSSVLQLFNFASVYNAAAMERIEWIKGGVDATNVQVFAERLDTSKDQLMKTLGLPRATIDRKAKAHQQLSTEQAERLVGLSKLVGQVQTMVEQSGDPAGFDAAQWVGRWLERPNPALGGRRPAELMDTMAGQEVVSGLVAKMATGAYA